MRTIIGYIINMLPYMILAIPIYLIVRGIIIKKHNKKINLYHELTLFIFVLFIVGLFSQTIIPKFEFGVNGFGIVKNGVHKTNLIPFRVLIETYREVFMNGYVEYFLINFLGNIILFIPFGFVIPLLWNVSNRKVIVIGACISFFIEISQLLLSRGTDVDDLILNTSGVILGLLLYKLLYKKFYKIMDKFKI